MLDLTAIGTWLGAANAIALFTLSCVRQRRVDYRDVGPCGAIFLASYNLCPPIYLFYFVANKSTRGSLPVALSGYDKYIAFAAICSLFITFVAMVSLYKKAREQTADAAGK